MLAKFFFPFFFCFLDKTELTCASLRNAPLCSIVPFSRIFLTILRTSSFSTSFSQGICLFFFLSLALSTALSMESFMLGEGLRLLSPTLIGELFIFLAPSTHSSDGYDCPLWKGLSANFKFPLDSSITLSFVSSSSNRFTGLIGLNSEP